MFTRYNDKKLKILSALGHYKFLSYSHMKRLGIETHTSNLSNLLKDLIQARKPLVKAIPHRPNFEKMFYLTNHGADVLSELTDIDKEAIKFPKHKVNTSSPEQKHRSQVIRFQIELNLAADFEESKVEFCDRYFDTTGNTRERNLKSKTALLYEENKAIKADMIFMLQLPNGTKELFTHEHENGSDSQKSIDKMIQAGKALLIGEAHEKYDYNKAYRTLWVFEQSGTMKAVLKKLDGNIFFENMKEHFLLKAEKENEGDFFGGWRNLDGEERRLYYL